MADGCGDGPPVIVYVYRPLPSCWGGQPVARVSQPAAAAAACCGHTQSFRRLCTDAMTAFF